MENENQTPNEQPKSWWNKYLEERPCARCEQTFVAKSPISRYCKDCRKAKTKENVANYRLRKRLHLVTVRKTKQAVAELDLCWWCLAWCKPGADCPDCGTPYDLKKATKGRNRQTASYLDIVAQNAKKGGKSPKVEIERIRNLRISGSYGNKQFWQDVDNILNGYLKTKGYRPMYNGVLVKTKSPKRKTESRPDIQSSP